MLDQRFRSYLSLHLLQILQLFQINLGLERNSLLGTGLSLRKASLNFPFTVEVVQGQNVSLLRAFVEIGVDLGFVDGRGHLVHCISTCLLVIVIIDCSEGFAVASGLRCLNLISLTVLIVHGFMGCDRPCLAAEWS